MVRERPVGAQFSGSLGGEAWQGMTYQRRHTVCACLDAGLACGFVSASFLPGSLPAGPSPACPSPRPPFLTASTHASPSPGATHFTLLTLRPSFLILRCSQSLPDSMPAHRF